MKADISRFSFAMALILFIGGTCVIWTGYRLHKTKTLLNEVTQKLQQLEKSEIIPTQENSELSEQNYQKTQTILKKTQSLFQISNGASPHILTPETWKQLLQEKLTQWNQIISLKNDPYYSFGDFHVQNPPTSQIPDLSIQLIAIDKLLHLFPECGISELQTLHRFPVKTTPPSAHVPFYNYPFELEFSCKPEALRQFINIAMKQNLSFIPRDLEVLNMHDPQQSLEQARKEQKKFTVVSGEESIHAKIQLDLLLWNENR